MIDITKINSLAELNRLGWEVFPSSSNEIKCKCPVHEDENPSLCLNTENNLFICQACKIKGDVIALLAYIGKVERKTIVADLLERHPDLSPKKVINQEKIEKWHSVIWNSGPLLQELYNRGITDDEIRNHRIGYSIREQRIMIPIYDLEGDVVNVRKYLPGADSANKMKNMPRYKTRTLYLIDQLKYETVWICGGELKALVSKRFLNPSNIGAVAFTGSEGAWDEKLNKLFKDKIVFICMDVDNTGREGARRIAAHLCRFAKTVYIINLDQYLDSKKYPKGDINDWVAKENAGAADFSTAMRYATKYLPPNYSEINEDEIEIVECDLLEVRKSESIGKKCKCSFIINLLGTENYNVPKDISISCTRDYKGCSICVVNSKEPDSETGLVKITLNPNNQNFLKLIGCNQDEKTITSNIREILGVSGCKSSKIIINNYYNVCDVRLGTVMDLNSNLGNADINQPAFIIGYTEDQLELNAPYSGICRNFPHPKDGSSTLIITELKQEEDNLLSFILSDSDFEELKIFSINNYD